MSDPAASREARFETVLDQFGEALWRITSGYADQDADRRDLHQDILVAIWRALPRFEGRSSLKTFVYRIAYNRGMSFRASLRRRSHSSLDQRQSDAGPGPEEDLEHRRRLELLRGAVRELPPAQRQVVMLRLDGLSHRQIAEVVGISEGNAAVRLSRAKKTLEQLLQPEQPS